MNDTPSPVPITRWVTARDGKALWLNATAVAVNGAGLLFLGAPGAGKSSLALALMAHGATLISDDGVWLNPDPTGARLQRPPQSPDLIEARGIGLLRGGPITAAAPLAVIVDLDTAETERLPPRRLVAIGDWRCPLIHGGRQPTLAAALVIMARNGCAEP
jgi:HPr kinase/phosphorylase